MNRAPLFALRLPSGIPGATGDLKDSIREAGSESAPGRRLGVLGFEDPGRDCPRLARQVDCRQPPHHLIEPCLRYQRGECWYTMASKGEEGLWPLIIQTHQSGRRAWAFPNRRLDSVADRDNWRLLVTTSALEIGFDHRELIGTWHNHAPPSVAAFVQRKGRGGRDVGDSPVSMMVLGMSASDVFAFQHHGRYVAVDQRDLVCWIDQDNPSVRIQHLVAGIFDFCAARESQRAYSMLDFTLLESVLRNRRNEITAWLSECFGIGYAEAAVLIDRVSKAVRNVWNAPLNLPPALGWASATPVSLFQSKKAPELRTAALTMPAEPAYRESGMWLLALSRARGEGVAVTAPEFFMALPDEVVEDPDLRVPASTIAQPLGRHIRVLNETGDYVDSDPAEFVLRNFLPGGFKIRYKGRLWMAPWKSARPAEAGSNLAWASLEIDEPGGRRPNLPDLDVAKPRRTLSTFLADRYRTRTRASRRVTERSGRGGDAGFRIVRQVTRHWLGD